MPLNDKPRSQHVDIVFSGPPGLPSPHLIEVEDDQGRGISFARWLQRPDGYWVIRFTREDADHWLAKADGRDLL